MGALQDAIAPALFGKTRRNLLALLFLEPDRAFHLRDLARRIGAGQGAVQRELRRLTDAGIIKREHSGHAIVYRANRESPVYEELRGLMAKTTGAVERLREALTPLSNRIDVAFLYGSFAAPAGVRPGSDVDLMVVGDVSFRDVVDQTASVQESLGREVNPTVYASTEFGERVRSGHHFVSDVLSHPKLFLIGGPRELERLAEVRVAQPASGDARRSEGTPRRRRSRSLR
jgi:predicted transcriptional regulator